MSSTRYLLSLDAGTGAGRCFITDVQGKQHFSAYREWDYSVPSDAPVRGLEFDAESFWNTLALVTREVIDSSGIDSSQIAAVSTTGMRIGFVLLDEAGREVFAVPNRDQRGWDEAREIEGQFGEPIHRVSGHWPAAIFAPARLLWLKRHRPEDYARCAHLLMVNDWVAYRLCGVVGCEPSSAGDSALYDIANLRWSDEVIRSLDLPRHIFPETRSAATIVGEITSEAAAQTHLKAGTPVVVGGGDTPCAILGSGGIDAGDTVAVAGTTTPVEMILGEPVIDPLARTLTSPYLTPGQWVLESSCGVTGTVLRWFRDAFCQDEIAEATRSERDAYDLMTEAAGQTPRGASGVFAMLAPVAMDVKHHYRAYTDVGGIIMAPPRPLLSQPNSKALFIRAILESFAYAIRANCEQIAGITGRSVQRLTVCGGMTSSPLWLRMLSDVLGMPVQVPEIREASSLGAAICAGVGSGYYADLRSGVDALVRVRGTIEPDTAAYREYNDHYQRWLSLQEQMKSIDLLPITKGDSSAIRRHPSERY